MSPEDLDQRNGIVSLGWFCNDLGTPTEQDRIVSQPREVTTESPRDRRLQRLAWAFFGISCALFIVGIVLSALNWSTEVATDWGLTTGSLSQDLFVTAMFSFSIVGIAVASRQPRNSVAWILLAIGFLWQLSAATAGYETYGLKTNPGAVPGAEISLALSQWIWVPAIGLIAVYLVLLFPDGHLPSRRWRIVSWAGAVAMISAAVGITFGTENFAEVGYPDLENPLAPEGLAWFFEPFNVGVALLPFCIVGAAISLIARYRRSRGVERLQLKWLATAVAAAALLFGVATAASFLYWVGDLPLPVWVRLLQELSIYSFIFIPIAVGIAIRRHRLYEIDALINRTLVYAILTAILAASYLGLVFGLQALLAPFTADSDLAVAGSTLAVAGMFRPARNLVQRFIDRRFYRRKFDSQRTLEAFVTNVRDQVNIDDLTSQLVGVVHSTVQPAHASLWLRSDIPR